jgi:ribosomal protein S18 acetylase RimI-like enzyme
VHIRPLRPGDRDRIHEILTGTGRFTGQEVGWAMDLVDANLTNPAGEYRVVVLEDESTQQLHGYACYGRTPRTDDVYDLYWLAVEPARQGQGLGQLLLKFVENEVRRQQGRMLLIETSSKASYAPTLRFYQRAGYDEISRIKDFYRIEHDKVVFCKKLSST